MLKLGVSWQGTGQVPSWEVLLIGECLLRSGCTLGNSISDHSAFYRLLLASLHLHLASPSSQDHGFCKGDSAYDERASIMLVTC